MIDVKIYQETINAMSDKKRSCACCFNYRFVPDRTAAYCTVKPKCKPDCIPVNGNYVTRVRRRASECPEYNSED